MSIFLIAGCGYVGAELAKLLVAAGHQVIGVTATRESAVALGEVLPCPVHGCDLANRGAVNALAGEFQTNGLDIGGVVHCASSGRGGEEAYRSVYFGGMRHLAEAFPKAHLVFTSSTSVYPQTGGEEVDENTPADPDRATGRLLREAEDIALGAGGAVARLAGIYGPGRWFLLKKFLEGTAAIEVRDDAKDGRIINSIHRDDAASAVAFLLEKQPTGVFNVADDMPLSQRAAYEILASHFGKAIPPDAAPDLNRKRGWTSKRVSNAKLRALGWEPEFETIGETLERDAGIADSVCA